MPTKITADNIVLTTLQTSSISVPKVSTIIYGDDDLATSVDGGQTITLNGTGFISGCQVLIDSVYANSVTFVSSTVISFITPARSAGTYPLYVVNPDGGTAIVIPGISYGGTPSFTTGAGSIGSEYETLSFSANIEATSDSAVTYAVSGGALPSGLSLNANTGVISGTLAAVASQTTYNFTIKASDAELQDTTRVFNITVLPDVITWNSPADSSTITQYETLGVSQSLNATSYLGKSITYTANTLPSNVSIVGSSITGNLAAGAANTVSLITATSNQTNKTATRTIIFTVNPDVVTWNSPANAAAYTQYETTSFTLAMNATSFLGQAISYSSATLPSGISISGANVTGTLPAAANVNSVLTATSAVTNRTADRHISFIIQQDVVTWTTPATATTSVTQYEQSSYSLSMSAASAAGKSISYSANVLPTGLSISGSTLSGTLSSPGTSSTLLTATAAGSNRTATRQINWTVTQDTVTWSSPANGTTYTNAQNDVVNISLSATSAAGYGISYSASGLPTGLSISGSSITGTIGAAGSFTATVTATAASSGRTASITLNWNVSSPESNAQWWATGLDNTNAFLSTTERMLFSTDTTNNTARATIPNNNQGTGSASNNTKGFWAGGYNWSGTHRITFASDTSSAASVANLGISTGGRTAHGTDDYGWWCGGYANAPGISNVTRLTYSDETASQRGAMIRTTYGIQCVGDTTYGWQLGGSDGSQRFSYVDRITYANDAITGVSRGFLNTARYSGVGYSSPTAGYATGGTDTVGATSSTSRITFATDTTTGVARGNVNIYLYEIFDQGDSTSTHGYFGGGNNQLGVLSSRWRMTFSSDSSAMSVRGNTSRARWYGSASAGQI